VRDLVQDGSVSRRGKIFNARTSEEMVVSEALVSALIGLTVKMQGVIDTLSEQLAAVGQNGFTPDDEGEEKVLTLGERERFEAEIRKLIEQRDRFQQDSEKWKGLYEESAGNAAARENQLKARFSTVKSTEARLDGLKQELDEAHRRFSDERTAAKQRESELREQIRKLKADSKSVQELQQQVEKWKSLYEHERSSGGRAKARMVADEAGDNDLIPRFRLEETEKKLAQVQKSYQQLLRAMNRNLSPRSKNQPPPADNLRRWQVS